MIPQCCQITSKFKPVTHVIFDLDGTLIDSEGVYGEALKKTIEGYGKTFSPDLIGKITGSIQRDVAKVTIETLDIDARIEDFLKIYNGYADEKLADLDLMPGARRIVRHLHQNDVPIAIATSSQIEAYRLKTEKYKELFSLFHHFICGGTDPEVKNGKPAPDIFLICASRFDNPPEPSKCLVFEDSFNGVKAALAAGMQVVMTPDIHVPYESWKAATLRLDSLEYMMPQLFELPPFPDESPAFLRKSPDTPAETTILAGFKE